MASDFTEEDVHNAIYCKGGLEAFIQDSPEVDQVLSCAKCKPRSGQPDAEEIDFKLWKFVKSRVLQKLGQLHQSIRQGSFIGSKVNLRTDGTKPMQLDILGHHDSGLFILELKVGKSAERNAFSELFAYSNYIASIFALSGSKDIANVLVANLDNKITIQAYLYDLIIADRNVIVYRPNFPTKSVADLKLNLYVPSDDEFHYLTNSLLSHDLMDCVVASFHDLDGWFDSNEIDGQCNDYTIKHLSDLSMYTAQLMESEGLHGFCFVRKRWREIDLWYNTSLIICAVNPFKMENMERSTEILEQVDKKYRRIFFETPEMGFCDRLLDIAKRSIKDALTHDYDRDLETADWGSIVRSTIEVVYTHNIGFRPTGILREAYSYYINEIYSDNDAGLSDHDISVLKLNELFSWSRAWEFMERCGFLTEVFDDDADDE